MQSQTVGEKLQKPDGGYCRVPPVTFGLLWWCLSEGLISSWAVRVGLALFEQRSRRSAFIWSEKRAGRGIPKFTPHFTAEELADLVGLPAKRVRAALRELLDLGVLAAFSPAEVRFARSVSATKLSAEQRSAFASWLKPLTRRRVVPIPRRVLVLAAESSSRALIAVLLGVCLRCSWQRRGEGCSFTGRVSCRWLARRFRLSPRAVESAKSHLVGLGWLERTGDINRLGEVVAINPHWHRLLSVAEPVPANGDHSTRPVEGRKSTGPRAGGSGVAPGPGTNSAGVRAPAGTDSAGVSLTSKSPSSREIKKPGRESPGAPAPEGPGPGICSGGPREKSKNQDHSGPALPPPRLSAIRPEDFRDVGRALELFRQAVKCGLMPNASEHSRLLWLAAIERARTVPARNPAGVFLHVVKGRKWDFLSDGHFEAANARLKGFLHGPAPGAVPFLVPRHATPERPREAPRPTLSKDALLVQLVREKLGGQGSVFAALHAHAGWDRERYARALAELEKAAEKGPSLATNAV